MVVYYASTNIRKKNIFSEGLEPLSSHLDESFTIEKHAKSFDKCPSFQAYIKNTFLIRSPYDYTISWDKENKKFFSSDYDQKFFEENLLVRNINTGLATYEPIFFTFFAEKDLEMEATSPWFHNTLNRHVVIPGVFNIGRHFRSIECPIQFLFSDTIKIKERDPILYVKFLTDEKIKFKKFYMSEKLKDYGVYFIKKRNFSKKILPLKWYYENSIRKSILKEIKNNIIE
jgi:hypothetical protein